MSTPFEVVILKLQNMGFFTFLLPFVIVSAVLYGLLRKSQIFGPPEKNVAVNAVVSISAAFMVMASPVIAGIDITQDFARFFAQSMIVTVVLMMAILIAGMVFPPDLPKTVGDKLGGRFMGVFLVGGIIVVIALLFTSGLMNVFFPTGEFPGLSDDTVTTIATIFILLVIVGVIVFATSRGEKKST